MGYFAQRCETLCKGVASEPALSPAEFGIIAALLDLMVEFREIDLKERNLIVDYTLSPTDENKQFIAAVIKHQGGAGSEGRVAEAIQSGAELVVPEHWVTRYFSDRCREHAAQPLPHKAEPGSQTDLSRQ